MRLPAHVEFRRALPADNDAILAFVDEHAMQAGLTLRFDRHPDFFALPRAHSEDTETWLLLQRDRISALGTRVIRPGYLDGVPRPVVYMGDLRVRQTRAVAGLWRALLAERLADWRNNDNAHSGFCAVIRDNRQAANALARQRPDDTLRFVHLRGYATVSIFARKPRRAVRDRRFQIRQAGPADTEAVRAFVDAQSRLQPYGVVFDDTTWQRRLGQWPGFSIGSFLLAFDAGQRLVGCLAPWDPVALKRIVIDAMPAGLNLLRHAYNALTPFTGKPRLQGRRNIILPDIALSHVAIEGRDPDVFAALLEKSWRAIARGRRYATASLCLYDGDPLWTALGDYWYHAVPMDLYSVCLPGDQAGLPSAASAFPGFEFYLV